MFTHRSAARAAFVVVLAMSAGVACQKSAAGNPESCTKYAEALCAKMGSDEATCLGTKSTVEVMPPAACQAGLNDMAYTEGKVAEQRKGCETLVMRLCTDLGAETEGCAIAREQTPKFSPARCALLTENYDQVLGELKRREAGNKPLSPEVMNKLAAADSGVFGPADAKVTVVEFSDFECPYCSKAADVVTQLKAKYPDQVRFVFRHFPLSFHPNAKLASQAVLAAHEQGKFWELHDLLFQNQKALDQASLKKYAQQLGLKVDVFMKAVESGKHEARVDADVALGNEVGVNGTPTMFINGQRVANPTDFAAVSALIDKALSKG